MQFVALINSLACGLAPVTTSTPGPMEVVRNGDNGILVPPRDTLAIENAVERLITDRPYLENLRRNAYATAQKYSWHGNARDNLTLYEATLSQKRGSK
ncbi:glycosyltransferase [Microcoleus sp. LAD1_D3]|uniref:glycosyltransferase n=1 Tax=Microcoleus sp. LAD1_D3 TaxID=2819365 RepID=UPI002FD3800B